MGKKEPDLHIVRTPEEELRIAIDELEDRWTEMSAMKGLEAMGEDTVTGARRALGTIKGIQKVADALDRYVGAKNLYTLDGDLLREGMRSLGGFMVAALVIKGWAAGKSPRVFRWIASLAYPNEEIRRLKREAGRGPVDEYEEA